MLCAVCGCNNYNYNNHKQKKEKVRYYSFPKDPILLEKWIQFCKRKEAFNTKTSRICSDHFATNDMERNLQFEMGFMKKNLLRLKPGSVPSIYKIKGLDSVSHTTNKCNAEVVQDCSFSVKEKASCVLLLKDINAYGHQSLIKGSSITTPTVKDCNIHPSKTKVQQQSIKKEACPTTDPIEKIPLRNSSESYLTEMNKLKQENFRLKLNEDKLHKTIKSLEIKLTKSNYENKNMECKLKSIFTSGQINKLKTGKRMRWTELDVAKSITLYSTSARAYKLLKKEKFPLPSVRTLQRWTQKSEPLNTKCKQTLMPKTMRLTAAQQESVLSSSNDVKTIKKEKCSSTNFNGYVYNDHSYFILKDSTLF